MLASAHASTEHVTASESHWQRGDRRSIGSFSAFLVRLRTTRKIGASPRLPRSLFQVGTECAKQPPLPVDRVEVVLGMLIRHVLRRVKNRNHNPVTVSTSMRALGSQIGILWLHGTSSPARLHRVVFVNVLLRVSARIHPELAGLSAPFRDESSGTGIAADRQSYANLSFWGMFVARTCRRCARFARAKFRCYQVAKASVFYS